ncbi:MAG: hypothetical protein ACYTGL_20660 [Planctomycetota bacterium]
MLIRTLVRKWNSGRSAAPGRRTSCYLLAALLAGASVADVASAQELPKLEDILSRKPRPKKLETVPARVKKESLFDVVDVEWEEKPVAVEPSNQPAPATTKLEPVPATVEDLVESIEGGDERTVSRALPKAPARPPQELKPAPPVASHGPVITQRLPKPQPQPQAVPATPPPFAKQFVLGPLEVEKLISRARKELAAGEVDMAHVFVEAAAETTVPLELFRENAALLIDEVELVRQVRFEQVAAWQSAEQRAEQQVEAAAAAEPETLANSIEQQPRVWRALGGPTLNTAPPILDRDGSRQELPESRGMRMMAQVPQMNQTMGQGRGWEPISYSWEAPALKYNPLYFEDPLLERHGNEVHLIQPVVSAARFYATIPTLPYQMGTEDNSVLHTVYDLGNDRPGTCVPYSIPLLPFSLTGALTQGGAATALVFILP